MGGRTIVRRGADTISAVVIAATVAGACDPDDSPLAGEFEIEMRALGDNGLALNGFRLNGFRLNGFRLNGFRLNGDEGSNDYIELEKLELADESEAAHTWLEGSSLHAETASGVVLSGAQLVGAVLHFGVVEGPLGLHRKRMLKIAGVEPLVTDPEVLLYDLQIKETIGPWRPLCTNALGLPTEAILLGEAWDPETGARIAPAPEDVVTLACRGGAIAKCVEWGYLPWEHGDHHQACTRAVRADYCGDGVPHTIDGLVIHVLDALGIQAPEPGVSWAVEAEWGPDGATCLDPDHLRLSGLTLECAPASCGEPFASGGLIQTGVLTL